MPRPSPFGDKTIKLKQGPWRRAKICAIEVGLPVSEWIGQAIATKADVQEKEGRLSKLGQRVAAGALVLSKQTGVTDGEPGRGVQESTGTRSE